MNVLRHGNTLPEKLWLSPSLEIGLDGALNNTVWCRVPLPTAGELGWVVFKGPFQPNRNFEEPIQHTSFIYSGPLVSLLGFRHASRKTLPPLAEYWRPAQGLKSLKSSWIWSSCQRHLLSSHTDTSAVTIGNAWAFLHSTQHVPDAMIS